MEERTIAERAFAVSAPGDFGFHVFTGSYVCNFI